VAVVEDSRLVGVRVADDAPSAIKGVPDSCVIAIDIPIGLPQLGRNRGADIEARALVGPYLKSSVFPAPAGEFVAAPTYEAAIAIAHQRGCPGVSRQTYALRAAILQVAAVAESDRRVHEVHPEVSFCLAKRDHLETRKASWNGMEERRRILEAQRLIVGHDLGVAGRAGIPDVLDAVACAWSAWRIGHGAALRLPAEGDARAPAIWG
jgi:predicted RNase H-like nuclease